MGTRRRNHRLNLAALVIMGLLWPLTACTTPPAATPHPTPPPQITFPEPPETLYADKQISVTGRVVEYKGKLEISVGGPDQITI